MTDGPIALLKTGHATGNSVRHALHCLTDGAFPVAARETFIMPLLQSSERSSLCEALLTTLVLMMLLAGTRPVAADEPAIGTKTGFRVLLDRHQRDALHSIAAYLAKNPEADDAEQAALWMFDTAVAQGLEAEVVGPAEQFLKRRGLDQPSISLAQQALAMGLARSGKRAEALAVYDAFLKGLRFQSPFRALDLAGGLSAQARIAGDFAAAREISERTSGAFSLHAQVRDTLTVREG